MLAPIYTITGSPISADDSPNVTSPAGARKFSPPVISVGPTQLWIYRIDGGDTGNFYVSLWYHDPTNSTWAKLAQVALPDKYMMLFPFEYGLTTEMFVQIHDVGGLSVTKVAYGFGIGSIAV